MPRSAKKAVTADIRNPAVNIGSQCHLWWSAFQAITVNNTVVKNSTGRANCLPRSRIWSSS